MRLRGGWPLALLVLLMIGIPILEVWLLLRVGHVIGVLPTVAVLVAEAVLGGWLMRREGARAWRQLNTAYASGRVPTGELADGALVVVGGVLLMVPGFFSDLIGFVFLLRWTRPLARKLIAFFVARRLQRSTLGRPPSPRDGVIEGETVEEPHPGPGSPPGPVIIRGEIEDPRD